MLGFDTGNQDPAGSGLPRKRARPCCRGQSPSLRQRRLRSRDARQPAPGSLGQAAGPRSRCAVHTRGQAAPHMPGGLCRAHAQLPAEALPVWLENWTEFSASISNPRTCKTEKEWVKESQDLGGGAALPPRLGVTSAHRCRVWPLRGCARKVRRGAASSEPQSHGPTRGNAPISRCKSCQVKIFESARQRGAHLFRRGERTEAVFVPGVWVRGHRPSGGQGPGLPAGGTAGRPVPGSLALAPPLRRQPRPAWGRPCSQHRDRCLRTGAGAVDLEMKFIRSRNSLAGTEGKKKLRAPFPVKGKKGRVHDGQTSPQAHVDSGVPAEWQIPGQSFL